MRFDLLHEALTRFKIEYEDAVRTATFRGKTYENGERARMALIRSSRLILKVHEVGKISICGQIEKNGRNYVVHPPLGQRNPELKVTGFIKTKKQDLTYIFDGDRLEEEVIKVGALKDQFDPVGHETSERSIVVGVRSQLSSIAKNIDTLMERSFAETLNLRLRLPELVMGEIYLIPTHEYLSEPMKANSVRFNADATDIEKFVKIFNMISDRTDTEEIEQSYKYERTALIVADFRQSPPKIYQSHSELVEDGLIPLDSTCDYDSVSITGFSKDLVGIHAERHPPR